MLRFLFKLLLFSDYPYQQIQNDMDKEQKKRSLFYSHDSISFVLSLSNPGILLHLGCSGFTQGVKVVLRERDREKETVTVKYETT